MAKPWGWTEFPTDFKFSLLPEDWEHFRLLMEQACIRIPSLETAPVRQHVNGPESFTPDNRYMLGEAPELRNFYVAAGFNSVGIASAAGAGQALAEWIVGGEPSIDLWDVDIRRFMPFQGNARYLRERTAGSCRAPLRDALAVPPTGDRARRALLGLARSPRRPRRRLRRGRRLGARRTGSRPRASSHATSTRYGRQNWFPCAAAEHRAVREAIGLFDQSSLAKFRLRGPDAVATLQRLCANDVDAAPGRIVYTQMLNRRGGIECDLTVTRLADDMRT